MHWTGLEVWIWSQTVQLMWRFCGFTNCFRQRVNMSKKGVRGSFYKEIRKRLFLNMCRHFCLLVLFHWVKNVHFLLGALFFFFKQILEKKLSFCCSLVLKESPLSILACIPIWNVDIYLASKRNIPKHLWVYASTYKKRSILWKRQKKKVQSNLNPGPLQSLRYFK